jgi:hypothetical protein
MWRKEEDAVQQRWYGTTVTLLFRLATINENKCKIAFEESTVVFTKLSERRS